MPIASPAVTLREVTLREVTPADDALIRRLFAEARADDFASFPGADAAVQTLIDLQFMAHATMLAERFPHALHEVVLADGTAVGKLVTAVEPDGIRLVDIAVSSEHQGRGIGTTVLLSLFNQADATGQPVELSVWELNERATRLYSRLGFTVTKADGGYLSMQRPAPAELRAIA